jgi:phosphotransferase system enzyme I (PtsI)
MIGIVVVSHSLRLAETAVELARQMVPNGGPRVLVAAGAGTEADGTPIIGTDATRVAAAIDELADTDGVLVLMDLGSAVLSGELALELTTSSVEVRLSAAPFVEGLLASIVRAAGGASLAEVATEADSALSPKQGQLGGDTPPIADPVPGDDSARLAFAATLVNPLGLHVRPASLIAAAVGTADVAIMLPRSGRRANAASPTALLALGARGGETIKISAAPAARTEFDRVVALVAAGFGEAGANEIGFNEAGTATAASDASPPTEVARSPRAVGVSPGRAIGPVVIFGSSIAEPEPSAALRVGARPAEAERIAVAAAEVAGDLESSAAAAHGEARTILTATALMARDPALLEAATAEVRDAGTPAPRAVWVAAGEIAESLVRVGGRIAERATDLRDVRDRLVAALTGQRVGGIPERGEPFVLVAHDLAPADTATLDPTKVIALVTEAGGPTSHTAIIARALGIPAVVGATGALDTPEGTIVLVDGDTGELRRDPDADTRAAVAAEAAAARPTRLEAPGRTRDGHPIALLANIGDASGARAAADAGAEGVGLFRSEFLFLDRTEAPSRAEQVAAYRAVFAAFPGRKVVVRTLDAGADKPLPFLTVAGEENPALGVRGLRTARRRPEVLDEQLAAIVEATAAETAEVQVMAPMVATLDETLDLVARCRAVGIASAGIMIETPAAALSADELLAAVDFVSIGTNDLTQYTMAADRMIGDLADLNDPWQPAVLRLIMAVGQASVRLGTPVGVCGEAAADPLLAAVLVGLGVSSLSMTPRALPRVAERLASLTRPECAVIADAAVAAPTAAAAREAARAALPA